MRRTMLIGLTLAAAGLALPGAAQARGHHHAHHACKRRRHCAHAHVLRFGTAPAPGGVSGTAGQSPAPEPGDGHPGPMPPPTPTVPSGPTNEDAGTVASFTGGVLTIALTKGGTVSGQVTEMTKLRCDGTDPDGGDTAIRLDGTGHGEGGGDDQEEGDRGGGDDEEPSCTTEALKEGVVVHEAELSVGSGGAVWEQIELGT